MQSNLLKLNASKTHILTVGTSQKMLHLPRKITVSMDNVTLVEDESKCEKLLGCYVSSDLKWDQNIKNVLSKLKLRLISLEKIKYCGTFEIRKKLADGLLNSIAKLSPSSSSSLTELVIFSANPATRHPPPDTRHPDKYKSGLLQLKT